MDPDEYTYPVRNSFYVNTITCIALSFATEAAVEQNSESCRWTTTQGHGEPVDHPTLSVLHEIGDDGARALAKALKVTRLPWCDDVTHALNDLHFAHAGTKCSQSYLIQPDLQFL